MTNKDTKARIAKARKLARLIKKVAPQWNVCRWAGKRVNGLEVLVAA